MEALNSGEMNPTLEKPKAFSGWPLLIIQGSCAASQGQTWFTSFSTCKWCIPSSLSHPNALFCIMQSCHLQITCEFCYLTGSYYKESFQDSAKHSFSLSQRARTYGNRLSSPALQCDSTNFNDANSFN